MFLDKGPRVAMQIMKASKSVVMYYSYSTSNPQRNNYTKPLPFYSSGRSESTSMNHFNLSELSEDTDELYYHYNSCHLMAMTNDPFWVIYAFIR